MTPRKKLNRKAINAFTRYQDGHITISDVCRRAGYLRKGDGRPCLSTFYRKFHQFVMGR